METPGAVKGMLGDFIRLTDYVAVEALVNLTIRTNQAFLSELLKPRKAGLFETTVLFTEEGTAFSPTCDDIKVRATEGACSEPCHGRSVLQLPTRRRFSFFFPAHFSSLCYFLQLHPIVSQIWSHVAGTPFPSTFFARRVQRSLPSAPHRKKKFDHRDSSSHWGLGSQRPNLCKNKLDSK